MFDSFFWYAVLGVVASVVLPILRAMLPTPPLAETTAAARMLPYVIVAAFSLITAALVIAIAGEGIKDTRMAFVAGYAWDSTLQKLKPLANM